MQEIQETGGVQGQTRAGTTRHVREDIRNVAIIAHVDHGKTTLVDGLLKQSKVFRENQQVGELIMDSNELERERGITILAKNTAIMYRGVKINIIDTPGHADFGGEVERVLNMADGCLLLVDAVEGPMPQTRFVLQEGAGAWAASRSSSSTRSTAATRASSRCSTWTQDLFLELATARRPARLPGALRHRARGHRARYAPDDDTAIWCPLFETILDARARAGRWTRTAPFQMLVTALDYDDYKGKYAIGRITRGQRPPGHERRAHRRATAR